MSSILLTESHPPLSMAAPRVKPHFVRVASLDALAAAAIAAGDTVQRRLVAHAATFCTCGSSYKGGTPTGADLSSCAPGALFVHLRPPHRYESDDALRLHGLTWRARSDPLYFLWATFDPPLKNAAHLDTERALAAAWAVAVKSQRWDIDAASCLGRADAALHFNAVTALVFIPHADVESVVERCAAALVARGAGTADDRVVALGAVPLSILFDAATDASSLRRAVTWVGCARDEVLALPLTLGPIAEIDGEPPATHADHIGHHLAAVRALHAEGALPEQTFFDTTYVLCMLQNFADLHQAYVDLPGGGRHCGETTEDAVHRELDEETGLGSATGTGGVIVQGAGTVATTDKGGSRIVHIFNVSALL